MAAQKYNFPREVGETVVISADSRQALRKLAHAAYQTAYRRGQVMRCKTVLEEMGVRVTRVV